MLKKITSNALLPALLILALALGYASVAKAHKQVGDQNQAKPTLLKVKASDLIGADTLYDGHANAKFTVIEFFDYQCPPCRMTNEKLPFILARCGDRVRYTTRQFPLSGLHKYAMPAAIAAEAASQQGKFWPMHKALFASNDLTKSGIDNIANANHLDMKQFEADERLTAPNLVKKDQAVATALGINATPTFLLCDASGKVWKLADPGQIEDMVN